MQFIIDLDKKLSRRYKKLIKSYDIKKIGDKLNEVYCQYLPKIPFINSLVSMITSARHKVPVAKPGFCASKSKIMYLDELEFWAKIFGVEFHKILVLQLLYEINSGCSTFVYDNVMYRIMDWPMEFLKEMT